jgi:hypothetical protein
MSIDFEDTIKNMLVTVFDDESLGATVSEQTAHHPEVQVWAWSGLWMIIVGILYVVGLFWWVPIIGWFGYPLLVFVAVASFVGLIFSRNGWSLVYTWNAFWYGLLFGLFFEFWALWIFDGLGWIEMDWVYQIFAPLNDEGEYAFIDDWVSVNTWTFKYTIEVIEKDTGVPFDLGNETHMNKLKDYTWPYVYEQMNLVNRFAGGMWLTNALWFTLCPQMYVDEEGIALDGYPLMLAKSFELSKMYNGDFSWMQDPYNRKIPITFMTFIDTAINITIGGFVHILSSRILGDAPAMYSIGSQLYIYFF